MKPFIKKDHGQQDLFRSSLDQIINMNHPLTRLGELLDWERLPQALKPYYAEIGRPEIPLRLIMGLHFLKYIYALSDEGVLRPMGRKPLFSIFLWRAFFPSWFTH